MSAHFDLFRLLVVREVRARYARTLLGAAWAVFPPLVAAALFSALDLGRLLGGDSPWRRIPYAAFAFSGLVFWMHFAQSLTGGTASLAAAREMLHKSKFPAELIPASKVVAGLFDLGIGFALLIVLMLIRGMDVPWTAALVPFVFALQLGFTLGLVLLFSALHVFFRDVLFVLQAAVPILMFASNVVVPIDGARGWVGDLLAANPIVSCLDAYRRLLFLAELPTFASLVPAVAGAAAALVLGALHFRRAAPRFPEEV